MSKKNSKKILEAAALKYMPGSDKAPKVVAAGKGRIAENIIKLANESKIPVHKDEVLAAALSTMNPSSEIPTHLYEMVAEILIFVAELDKKYGEMDNNGY